MDLLTIDSLPSLLQDATTIYSFAAGQRLFRQGDRSSNFFIVESGRIKLVRFTIEGRMVVLQVVRRGESLGENTFVSNAYSYTAIAEVESRAIAYPQPLLTEALDEYPELAENLREKLIEKIQSLKVSLELLQIRSAHLRLLQYLQSKAAASDNQTVVNLDQPLKEVATELDLTPRTISRALTKLESEGRIIRQANSIITRNQAEETAKLVEAQGAKAALVSGDLGQAETVKRTFDTAFENFGQVDILVNNAGAIVKKPMAEVTDEDLERMININTRGTFFCTREAARRISDNGRIINIGTSLLAGMAPNYSAYAGTKAVMEEVTRTGARELGERGITLNTISPGPIDTPFFHSQETPESTEFASNLAVAGRLGTIDDIVPLVEFLALPSSQWVTGQTIWVNGGYLTR